VELGLSSRPDIRASDHLVYSYTVNIYFWYYRLSADKKEVIIFGESYLIASSIASLANVSAR